MKFKPVLNDRIFIIMSPYVRSEIYTDVYHNISVPVNNTISDDLLFDVEAQSWPIGAYG